MTDSRWISSAGPRQYGTSKIRTSPPTSSASWRAPSALVRSVRPMHRRSGRSQNVSPPSIVPGASMHPSVGIPAASVQASRASGSASRFGLPGRKGGRPTVCDEQRIERVDEVRAGKFGRQPMNRGPKRCEGLDEGIVLALCQGEIDRMEEAVSGIVKGAPERRPRPLHEDFAKRAGHALSAVAPWSHRHRHRIATRHSLFDPNSWRRPPPPSAHTTRV